jgi:protein-S-isoprenylcysteine O-methyltransferase Ste14
VVLFVLIRRTSRHVSQRPAHWLIAFGATAAPLLVWPNPTAALLPPVLAAVVMLIGMFVQLHAKVVLARSFGCVPANRGLKFSGPYQFVRHPMYLGYLISHMAVLAMNPSGWNLGVFLVCYGLQVPRLLIEERFLLADSQYQDYAARVRYRLLPGLF